MAKQKFTNNDQISPAIIQDNDTMQMELGVDGNAANVIKFSVQSSGGATFGNPMITIDGSVNGDITLSPNGSGNVVIDTLTAGAVMSDAGGSLTSGTLGVDYGGTGATTLTDHGVLVGSGTAAITALAVGTNGQVLLGSSGADPVFATLTSTDGTITFTTGAGTLDLEASGTLMWTEETDTGPTTMTVNNGYIANNAGQVVLTLPAVAALGSVFRVTGKGAGGWKVAQEAGQTITWNQTTSTTTGATGYLESTDDYDSVELICLTANTLFGVLSSKGNITVS